MVTLEENTIKRELAKFPNLGEFNLDNLQIEFIAYISINKINIELANLSAVIDIKAFMSTPQKGLALVVQTVCIENERHHASGSHLPTYSGKAVSFIYKFKKKTNTRSCDYLMREFSGTVTTAPCKDFNAIAKVPKYRKNVVIRLQGN